MVLEYNVVNDRIISISLCRQPFNMMVIQAYAPTTEPEEQQLDEFCAQVNLKCTERASKICSLCMKTEMPKFKIVMMKMKLDCMVQEREMKQDNDLPVSAHPRASL